MLLYVYKYLVVLVLFSLITSSLSMKHCPVHNDTNCCRKPGLQSVCKLKNYCVNASTCPSGRPIIFTHQKQGTTTTLPCNETIENVINTYTDKRNKMRNEIREGVRERIREAMRNGASKEILNEIRNKIREEIRQNQTRGVTRSTLQKAALLTCYSDITRSGACMLAHFLWNRTYLKNAERELKEGQLKLLFRAVKSLYGVLTRNGWKSCPGVRGDFPDIFPRILSLAEQLQNKSRQKITVDFLTGQIANIKRKKAIYFHNSRTVVMVPQCAWKKTKATRVTAVFYNTNAHFFTSNTSDLVHRITSVNVEGVLGVQNLTQDLTIEYKDVPINFNQTIKCVYWIPANETWSSKGCKLNTSKGYPVCMCNHLTNFGILISPTLEQSEPLSSLSKAGCIISIIFFALTILTQSVSRETRKRRPVKILINICINLMIAMLVFVVGVEKSESAHACLLVTFLLHYFFLCGWCWMTVYSYEIYHCLVKVFRLSQRRYIQKAALISYGLPLIVTVTTIVAAKTANDDTEEYRAATVCWLKHYALYFGFLLPVGLLLLFNLFVFCAVLAELHGANKNIHPPMLKRSSLQSLILSSTIISMNGITWVFGMMLLVPSGQTLRTILNVAFIVTSSFQGLFVFLFTSVRPDETRHAWVGALRRCCSSVKKAVTWETGNSQTSSFAHPDPMSTAQSAVAVDTSKN